MGVMRKFLNWYGRLGPSHGKTLPPYEHVVQVGDPTLRKVSELVPIPSIKSESVQKVIKKLECVLDKYGSLGMSAPQIGVNMRIFVMKHTNKQISYTPKEIVKSRGMSAVPFTVFINPKLKVIDYTKVVHSEGCESVQGYLAEVPRYREVEVTGYNSEGEITSKIFKDWPARIAQHEIDHLDGKLYIDRMDRKTFSCTCWEEVNLSKGKLVIPFHPE
ncbi:peptide deformylase, mitochondrial-like isoform X1 [Achroia grisella]|uniref:peptide deformylase, mitochondrial-like isoform X1 n=1 Tax=Achroia grisella TaxID=688607 RepID=UPI0027D3344C|nr:peptide deformylase, mitochondrial-like isoform X1 [Achroia grisella]